MHFLRDPKTKVYNFTPYLEDITQPLDFDYDSLQPYITSSKDTVCWFGVLERRDHWLYCTTEPCGFSQNITKTVHWIHIIRVRYVIPHVLCHVKLQTSKHFLFVPRIRKWGKQKQKKKGQILYCVILKQRIIVKEFHQRIKDTCFYLSEMEGWSLCSRCGQVLWLGWNYSVSTCKGGQQWNQCKQYKANLMSSGQISGEGADFWTWWIWKASQGKLITAIWTREKSTRELCIWRGNICKYTIYIYLA